MTEYNLKHYLHNTWNTKSDNLQKRKPLLNGYSLPVDTLHKISWRANTAAGWRALKIMKNTRSKTIPTIEQQEELFEKIIGKAIIARGIPIAARNARIENKKLPKVKEIMRNEGAIHQYIAPEVIEKLINLVGSDRAGVFLTELAKIYAVNKTKMLEYGPAIEEVNTFKPTKTRNGAKEK